MDPLSCTEEKYVAKDAVYCPDCTRNYTIIGVRHICNQFLRCQIPPPTKYFEEYISTEQSSASICKCAQCELKIKRANAHVKAMCKCGYEGRYKMRPDKLCPLCAMIADAPKVPTTPINIDSTINTANTDEKIKIKATIVLIMDHMLTSLKNVPNVGYDNSLANFRMEIMTDESMTTDIWAIQCFGFAGKNIESTMHNISDWLKKNSTDYYYHWLCRDSIQFLRFQWMYNKYTNNDRFNI